MGALNLVVLPNYPYLSPQFWPNPRPLYHIRLLEIDARKTLLGYCYFPPSLLGRNEHAKSTTAWMGKGARGINNRTAAKAVNVIEHLVYARTHSMKHSACLNYAQVVGVVL